MEEEEPRWLSETTGTMVRLRMNSVRQSCSTQSMIIQAQSKSSSVGVGSWHRVLSPHNERELERASAATSRTRSHPPTNINFEAWSGAAWWSGRKRPLWRRHDTIPKY
ncbi:hypothetical protein Bca52824_083074 [Brassica carinata]|uniref:Uncharacterized protein n=1 Tax=Brassica carinata TaxID=52824 RepID=A0A8X7PLR5_BRACI|nr:hypothetical protein Bca52824_083074 [Brassica carinata]